MLSLTIGEVARRAGMRTSALRYYERIGLLPAPARISGQRRYDDQVLQRLAVIRFAQRAGFTLATIQRLFALHAAATLTAAWRVAAHHKLGELDAEIARAQQMKHIIEQGLACDCGDLEQCSLIRS